MRRGTPSPAPETKEERENLLRRLDARLAARSRERLREWEAQAAKPAKTAPDSPAANIGGTGIWAILAAVGAMFIIGAAATERPAALLPLAVFLGLAALGGWVLFREGVLGNPGHLFSLDKLWVRWTACVGLTIAAILAVGGLLRVVTSFFR